MTAREAGAHLLTIAPAMQAEGISKSLLLHFLFQFTKGRAVAADIEDDVVAMVFAKLRSDFE